VWIDLNKDGDWADLGENVLSGLSVNAGSTNVGLTFGSLTGAKGPTWARFRFSSAGINSPTGVAPDGEVEDYLVTLAGPPFHNALLPPDVNNNGFVTTIDLLIILNYLTYLTGQLQVPGPSAPLPVTIPPYKVGTPPIDPTGGGVPGQGLFLDVAPAFGVLNTTDLLAVITYLTNFFDPGGEGEAEGEGGSAPAASLRATGQSAGAASSAALFASAPLYASSSITIEERPAATGSALDDDSWLDSGSDDTLDLVAAAIPTDGNVMGRLFSLDEHSNRRTPMGPLDENAWDDLLSELSLDVGGLPGHDLEN